VGHPPTLHVGGLREVPQALGTAAVARDWLELLPVARGAGGCEPGPYSAYISALWCLCNPGLGVRSVEARPEQELLGIWGPVLLA